MKRTFKVNIVFTFTLLLLITGAVIISFTYFKNKQSTLAFVKNSFEHSAVSLIEKTSNYMQGAQILTEISVTVLEDPKNTFGLNGGLNSYLLEVVRAQPQIELFYFGDEQGNFQQSAILDGEVYSKLIDRRGQGVKTKKHFFDDNNNVTRVESPPSSSYDHRARPWYKGAKSIQKTFWSDPYIFFATGKPGITVASPVFNKDESLKGIVAADITLGGLSEFLKAINLSEHGLAFIYASNGELVAFPDPDAMVRVEDGKMRNLRPQELDVERITEAVRYYEDSGENIFHYKAGGGKHLAYFSRFPDNFSKDWTIALIAPEEDFIGNMKHTLQITLLLSLTVMGIAIFLGVFLARQLSRPIEQLTAEVEGVRNFNLDQISNIESPIFEIQEMDAAIRGMKQGLKSFQKYVPATLVKQLIESGEDVNVGGKDRELTLFFSDIENFVRISESMPPRDLLIQLSEYLDTISTIIAEENGTVDKFIGDSVMAFWGAPLINDDHAPNACRAALRCQDAIAALNKKWQADGRPVFSTRIGIHTGFAIVGNIGSDQRMNYTVLGDSVNLASRLEGANKYYGTKIIVSRGTYRYIQNDFLCRVLDQLSLKGKDQPELIYELIAEIKDDRTDLKYFCDTFNAAYDFYKERQWLSALNLWKTLSEKYPKDLNNNKYIQRCEKYIENEPDESWSAITRLQEK